ncbi:hypothetical protein, partial [Pandoraea capi]|uniref:hypothetical protein n=1 Tax=Pandoraea capi TaxID=2508286 RepID=UPI001C2D453D
LLHVRLLLRKRTLLDSGWPCLQGAGQDGGTLCAWRPGWTGWRNWTCSLSDSDLKNLMHVLGWLRGNEFTHQWPEPGMQESAAFKVTRKVEK